MVQEGQPGATVKTGKFRPGIRGAHINDPNSFDAGLRWFDSEEARRFAALHTAPEFALRGDNKMLVERIGMDFAAFFPP